MVCDIRNFSYVSGCTESLNCLAQLFVKLEDAKARPREFYFLLIF